MSDTFDPYRKWLGIPPAEQPPNHYRLLGVMLFEDDADAIENAADRQMSHVRNFQTGKHSADSQKILNELSTAKRCLLSQEKKAAYDETLRHEQRLPPPAAKPAPRRSPGDSGLGSSIGVAERPLPAPAPPRVNSPAPAPKPPGSNIGVQQKPAPMAKIAPAAPVAQPATPTPRPAPAPVASAVASVAPADAAAPEAPPVAARSDEPQEAEESILNKRKSSRLPLIYVAAAALGAVVVITAVLIVVNLAGGPTIAEADATQPPAAADDGAASVDPPAPTTDEQQITQEQIDALPPAERLEHYLAEAAKLTASRDYAKAGKILQAQQELAVEAGGVDRLNSRIALNDMANGLYYNFHNALRKFVKKKQPFEFEGDTFELVKKGKQHVTYNVNGQEYTFEPHDIPPHHVAAFAYKSLTGDDPQHLRYMSAFFAVDAASVKAEPDFTSARTYYDQALDVSSEHEPYLAALLGIDIPVEDSSDFPMIVTLGDDETEPPEPEIIVAAVTPKPVTPSPAEGMSFFTSDTAPPAGRTPPPTAVQVQASRAAIQQNYRKTISRVTDVAGQLAFAGTLLNDAPAANTPAMQHEMYKMAAGIYSRLGAVAEYNSVLNLMEQKFEIDTTAQRNELITSFVARKAAPPQHLKEVYDIATASAQKAAKEHRYREAADYTMAALKIASKVKDTNAIRAMKDLRATLNDSIEAEKDYQAALETLKATPKDPDASQTAGRWLCYRLRDWDAGLPHLAESKDPAEAAAAQADLAPPATPTEKAAVAKLWNDLVQPDSSSGTLPEDQKWAISERAVYWLDQAFPELDEEQQAAATATIEAFKAMPKP